MSFLAPAVGGLVGGIFGGKGQKQTTTSALDPTVQKYRDTLLQSAAGLAGRPVAQYGGPLATAASPYVGQAAGFFGNASSLIDPSLAVLSGDPSAIAKQMNPYQSTVLGGLNDQYGVIRNATQQQLADQATRAGAFGGSRYGVALGQALGDVGRAQGQQAGQLLYQGYGDIMNRAGANLGMGIGAAGQLGGLGIFNTGLEQQNNANLYNEFLRQQSMPYANLDALRSAVGTAGALGGGTTTQTKPGSGFLGGAIGGALAGGGLWNFLQPNNTSGPHPCDTSVTGMCN